MKTKAYCSIDDLIIFSHLPVRRCCLGALHPELYVFHARACYEHEKLKESMLEELIILWTETEHRYHAVIQCGCSSQLRSEVTD